MGSHQVIIGISNIPKANIEAQYRQTILKS